MMPRPVRRRVSFWLGLWGWWLVPRGRLERFTER